MTQRNARMRRSNWRPATTTVMLLLCFVLVTPAGAAIVYDNGAPSQTGAFLSDDDSGFRFADDFLFASPNLVNAIRFWGVYFPSNTPTEADDFSVIFDGNSGGLPDGSNVIASFSIGDPGRIDTGDILAGGGTIFEYVASFSALLLPAGQYWVSVSNDTAADSDDNWGWARHAFPGNDARSLDMGATWLHEFSDSELAFQLLNLQQNEVPEPSMLAIWSFVGISLIGLRRRELGISAIRLRRREALAGRPENARIPTVQCAR
jgi:hypothetical protein